MNFIKNDIQLIALQKPCDKVPTISQEQQLLLQIYNNQKSIDITDIPLCRPLDHTMHVSIDRYVSQKLPTQEITSIIAENGLVELHSIYPQHFIDQANRLGLSEIQNCTPIYNNSQKTLNSIRPGFFLAKRGGINVLIIAVTPGLDYFRHYSAIVRHYISNLTISVDHFLRLYWYPDAENQLPQWTQFNSQFIRQNDSVVLGYVDEICKLFLENKNCKIISVVENEFYKSTRIYIGNDSVINFIGSKFSYWGNIAAILTKSICELGAKEIFYCAKLGTLTSERDIYSKIFCPIEFINLTGTTFRGVISSVPNFFLNRFPELNTGRHASVPTVLEEDYSQRNLLQALNVRTIDNEISKIAESVQNFNRLTGKQVSYSPIHFATDYLRSVNEKTYKTSHDLSNNRSLSAIEKKYNILLQISSYLKEYFYATN